MGAKLPAKTTAIHRLKVQRPSKVSSTHSDEEEDSSDGDDSIHTSDEEFIEHDSELDPYEDYACSTTSGTDSETATESSSETASDSSSSVVLPSSSEVASEVSINSNKANTGNDNGPLVGLVTTLEGMSLASNQGSTEGGGGSAILAWLNEQAKLEVSKMGSLIRDKFR